MTSTQLTFKGIDVNLEISLLEYGLLVSNEENKDGSKTHFVIYRIDENHFDTGRISEKQINGYIEGSEFPDEREINRFLSFVGMTKTDWLKCSLEMKLHDLFSYWGYENIMGTSYSLMTQAEAIERYLN